MSKSLLDLKPPNNLPETKEEYLHRLLRNRLPPCIQIAIAFYHMEVPLHEAHIYLNRYEEKLNWKFAQKMNVQERDL